MIKIYTELSYKKKESDVGRELLKKAVFDVTGKKEYEIFKGKNGKPYFKDLPFFFNISHSKGLVVLAIADFEVGIDIEKIREMDLKIAEKFFSKEEWLVVKDTPERFIEIWTKKESYLKLLGDGLSKDLNSFDVFDLEKDRKVYFRKIDTVYDYECTLCTYNSLSDFYFL